MWLRVLGLPTATGQWWQVINPVVGPAGDPWVMIDGLLRHRFPGYRFSRSTQSGGPASQAEIHTVVARPGDGRGEGQPPGPRDEGPEVLVVTEDGPDAGRLAPLPRSGLTVGRNGAEWRLADPFLSAPHFRLDMEPDGVRITELGSRAEQPGREASWWHGDRHYGAGSSEFRLTRGRPDALAPARPLPALLVDPGAEPVRPNPLLQAIMATGPLVIGVVMAVVTGLWYFLLFSLVSVAVVAVMWSQHRAAARRHRERIQAGARQIRDQLHDAVPTPGRLSLAARSVAVDRFGVHGGAPPGTEGPIVRWGMGTARLPMASEKDNDAWGRWATVELPATSVLRRGGATLVTGQPTTLNALASWLQVQLCRDAVATGRGVLVRTPDGERRWGGGPGASPGTVLCWPGTTVQGLPEGWHRVLLRETSPSEDREDAHGDTAAAQDRLDPDRGLARLADLEFTGFRYHGMTAPTVDWLLDEMGATERPRLDAGAAGLALPDPLMAGTAVDALTVELASGEDAVGIDLVAHGPHLLVAGTTGSGKSELLLTLLTGMAAAHPATEVSFVLMDFKGGSSFAALARLPHTMSVETNLAEAESLRTLDALSAELRRREELFLAAGATDFRSYRRSHPGADLPRLVVAVDELRVLMDEHPQAAALLARLAATGRSLGFHLVLATQRAQGAVGPDIRSNLGTVICLRTATEQESWDLLGTAEAFTIPAGSPGQAYLKHGGQPARPFRAGQFSVATGPPALAPWTPGHTDTTPAPWPDLVALIRNEAENRHLPVPPVAVTPALPDSWTTTPAERSAVSGAVVVGLADLPRKRAQVPVRWRPGLDAPAAWIGTAAGGVDEAARSVLIQLADQEAADTADASAVTTVVLDGAAVFHTPGGTAPAGPPRPPAHWSVLTADQATAEALAEVFDRLRSELARPSGVRLVVTHWGRWATQRIGTGYETFEEHLTHLMRDHGPGVLSVALFGGRELAGGRALGQVPLRFYLPAGTTPEHRMVWPTLQRVKEVPGRAVMVSPEHPAPGVAVQLAALPSTLPTAFGPPASKSAGEPGTGSSCP
ncbi:FtsK/SpoIIIE domain-containing protein [Microbacterium sp. A93]|uniref:FtsK/SpoIIIE domain-containing protein n=1 Tax=Microbacterium sp. A93 TaxID=3450716 RepID=UPI003F420E06